jgi:hypothetical protein
MRIFGPTERADVALAIYNRVYSQFHRGLDIRACRQGDE